MRTDPSFSIRNTGASTGRQGTRIPGAHRSAAFSLIEIMVVVVLLSVIILGLMAMFNQVQRAFQLGMGQTDVLETGRIATDLMVRELEQAKPGHQPNTVNFLAELTPPIRRGYTPAVMVQILTATDTLYRTNPIQQFFFLKEENRAWKGIGYFVYPANDGIGSLYRYEFPGYFTNNPHGLAITFDEDMNDLFQNGVVSTRFSKIADGVMLLRLRAYDNEGRWLNPNTLSLVTNSASFFWDPLVGESRFYFYGNAVPASLELEMGVLEQEAYRRFKAFPVARMQLEFLTNHPNQVHLFRQRIAVHNVDPSAYKP